MKCFKWKQGIYSWLRDMSKKLNLSRAPWWGGQFERLIRVIKIATHKVIVGGVLTCYELSEVLLDVETQIN